MASMVIRGDGKIQRLESEGRCEEVGCYAKAEWYINFGEESFYWCPKHTVRHMREGSPWQVKVSQSARR